MEALPRILRVSRLEVSPGLHPDGDLRLVSEKSLESDGPGVRVVGTSRTGWPPSATPPAAGQGLEPWPTAKFFTPDKLAVHHQFAIPPK